MTYGLSLEINKDDLSETISRFLDQISSNEDKTVCISQKEDFETLKIIFDCLKSSAFGSAAEKSKIVSKLISVLSDAVYELVIIQHPNYGKDANTALQRIKDIFKNFDFCIGFVEDSSSYVLFETILSLIISPKTLSFKNQLIKTALLLFISKDTQRPCFLSKTVKSIFDHSPLKKEFNVLGFSSGKPRKKTTISCVSVLYLFALQSVSVLSFNGTNNNQSIETKTSLKSFTNRYESLSKMVEQSLSELFTFTFCSAESLCKKDVRRPLLDFFDDVINTLFLPEFPVSETVATYLLIFIVAFISGENAKKVNAEVKTTLLRAVKNFLKKLRELEDFDKNNAEDTKYSGRGLQAVEMLLGYYSNRKASGFEKFYLHLSRQFYLLNCVNTQFKNNKHVQAELLRKFLNPLKTAHIVKCKPDLSKYAQTAFRTWKNRKVLDSIVDVNFAAKVLLMESSVNVRIQAMKLFANFIATNPALLETKNVFDIFCERCRDKSANIREMAVDILGQIIKKNKRFGENCAELLISRAMDSSVLVRKKVLAVLKECLIDCENSSAIRKTDIFENGIKCILGRVLDKEKSVRTKSVQILWEILSELTLNQDPNSQTLIISTLIKLAQKSSGEKSLAFFVQNIVAFKKLKPGDKTAFIDGMCVRLGDMLSKNNFCVRLAGENENLLSGPYKNELQHTESHMRLLKILARHNENFVRANYSVLLAQTPQNAFNMADFRISDLIHGHFLDMLFVALFGLSKDTDATLADLIKDDLISMVKTKSSFVLKKAIPCLSLINDLFPNLISEILEKLFKLCQNRIESGLKKTTSENDSNSVKNVAKISKKRKKLRKSDLPLPRSIVVFGLLLRHFEIDKISCESSSELYFRASPVAAEKALALGVIVNGAAFSRRKSEFGICENVLNDAIENSKKSENVKMALLKAFSELVKIEGGGLSDKHNKDLALSRFKPERYVSNGNFERNSNFLCHFCQENMSFFECSAFTENAQLRKISARLIIKIVENNLTIGFKLMPLVFAFAVDPVQAIRAKSYRLLVHICEDKPSLLAKTIITGLLLTFDYIKSVFARKNGFSDDEAIDKNVKTHCKNWRFLFKSLLQNRKAFRSIFSEITVKIEKTFEQAQTISNTNAVEKFAFFLKTVSLSIDAPSLKTELLRTALDVLKLNETVLGPSECRPASFDENDFFVIVLAEFAKSLICVFSLFFLPVKRIMIRLSSRIF